MFMILRQRGGSSGFLSIPRCCKDADFTSSTYLGSRDGDGVDTIFHHAQRLPIKSDVSAAVKQEIAALRDKVFGVLAVPRYR